MANGAVYRIYPHTKEVRQYAVDRPDSIRPWITPDRQAMLSQVRAGEGLGLMRIWTPSLWIAAQIPGEQGG